MINESLHINKRYEALPLIGLIIPIFFWIFLIAETGVDLQFLFEEIFSSISTLLLIILCTLYTILMLFLYTYSRNRRLNARNFPLDINFNVVLRNINFKNPKVKLGYK